VKMERVCRPDSVRRFPDVTIIPLGPRLPGGSSHLPARSEGRPERPKPRACLFGVAPGGVWRAAPVARDAVGSYPTVSPLPATGCPAASAVCSLCHFPSPWARPFGRACCAWPLASTLPAGVRTFLPGIRMPRRSSDPLHPTFYPLGARRYPAGGPRCPGRRDRFTLPRRFDAGPLAAPAPNGARP
jgi:hypothetical protein